KQYLSTLERPVDVYMLLDPGDPSGTYDGMKTILSEMGALNPRYFHWEEVPVEGGGARIRDLSKRFKQFAPRQGLLVTYGDKPEENHSYISASELTNFEFTDRGSQRPSSFNGEPR